MRSLMDNWNGNIELVYRNDKDMLRNNFAYLKYKACFLQKLQGLKLDGQCVVLKWWLHDWINENMDDIWESTECHKKHFNGFESLTDTQKSIVKFKG